MKPRTCHETIENILQIDVKYLNIMNPLPPRLYSTVKLHKKDHPIRPTVSFRDTPIEQLARTVAKRLPQITRSQPDYTIKNCTHLIEQLKKVQIEEGDILLSFDVENLFTSIPKKEAVKIIEQQLMETNFDKEDIGNLLTLLNLIL